WADGSAANQWAPSVAKISPTSFVMYYVSHLAGTPGQHCIGRAVATAPEGPFVDDSPAPLQCNTAAAAHFWSLDPSPFLDWDGNRYLVWRQDDGSAGHTNVFAQQLDKTGASFAAGSAPVRLITKDAAWEAPVIENPSMRHIGGGYFLFYSANAWRT